MFQLYVLHSSRMAIIDISPKISPRTGVFPGDQAFELKQQCSFKSGQNFDLHSITTTLHIGAHADAPSHYRANTPTIEGVDLKPYLGACQVIHVTTFTGDRVLPANVPELKNIWAKRVLFCTNSFPDPDNWNSDFKALSPELILELHRQGVVLVGIDTPSVDPEQSKPLESHQALADTDMRVLEGLVLTHVPPGLYTLIAAPLKLEHAEAAPVRALLLSDISDLQN